MKLTQSTLSAIAGAVLVFMGAVAPAYAGDKTPSGVVIGVQPDAMTLEQLNQMSAQMAAEHAAHPVPPKLTAAQAAAEKDFDACNVYRPGTPEFRHCSNAAMKAAMKVLRSDPNKVSPEAHSGAAAK